MSELLDRLEAALADRYHVEGQLGAGGMATVFLAEDLKHHRKVAIKVLSPAIAAVLGSSRFLREIEIAATLTHPHIVPLHDSGTVSDLPYYVMPFVQGESLRDYLRRERQCSLEQVTAIVGQVAEALDYAHDHGVVHRDIKPENILLAGEVALVADFGVATAVQSAGGERLTGTGVAVGTPEYMSPEQAAGEGTVDRRSDVYALGCVVYEMLAGAPPFQGASPQAVLARHHLETPPALRIVRPTIPESVEAGVNRALAKVPADRFRSAGDFVRQLASQPSPAVLPPGPRRVGRRWTLAAAALAVVGMAALIALFGLDSSVRLGPRDWILVAEFASPRDEPELGRTVRDLVTAELNQSSVLRTVPAEQVAIAKQSAGIADSIALDATLAREIGYRTSVRVIVTGSIARLGHDTYSLVLHVIDVEDGSDVLSKTTSATDRGDELVRKIQELVREVRLQLGEQRELVEANRPLMAVRTPSFAAFRHYSDGVAAQRLGNYAGSTVLLQQAVAVDSEFAAAWAVMAMNYMTSRRPDSARWAFTYALRHPQRLTEAEEYRLRADAAFNLDHDLAPAVRWYDAYLQVRPLSVGGRNNRALYLAALGRHEDAVREFETAATVDPLLKGPRQIQLLNLAAELVVVGRLDSARATARRLSGAPAQYMDLLFLSATSQWDSAVTLARRYATNPSTERFVRIPAHTVWAAALVATGRVAEAEGVLRSAADSARGGEARWFLHALLLLSDVTGRPPGRLGAIARDTTAGAELLRGLFAARTGDIAEAREVLDRLRRLDGRGRKVLGWGVEYLEAQIAAREGRWDDVVRLLGPAARAGEHDPFSLDRVGSLTLRWLAAEAYERLGQRDSAVAMLELVVAPTGLPPGHYCMRGIPYSFAQRRLALAHAALGRAERSRSHWRAFTDAWTTPDSEHQHLLVDPTGGAIGGRK